jgi:hypothetical protein
LATKAAAKAVTKNKPRKQRTVKVYPGEPLPRGIYVNGWKLDRSARESKPRALYLILEEEDE